MDIQMFNVDLEKAEELEKKIANIHWIIQKTNKQTNKQENSSKISTSALLIMPKPLTV